MILIASNPSVSDGFPLARLGYLAPIGHLLPLGLPHTHITLLSQMECKPIDSNDMSIAMGGYSAAVYSQDAPYYPTTQHVPPMMDFHSYKAYMPTEVVTGCDGLMPLLPPSPSQSPESNSHLRRIQPALSPDRLIRTKNRPAFPSQLLRSQSAGNMRFAAMSSELGPVKRISPSDKERAGRKKGLSLEQKRAMCRLHDKHPTMRQADIGQIFGVDRRSVTFEPCSRIC